MTTLTNKQRRDMAKSVFKDLASKAFDIATLALACLFLGNALADILTMIVTNEPHPGLGSGVGIGCASFGLYHLKNNVWSANAPSKSSESAESEDR